MRKLAAIGSCLFLMQVLVTGTAVLATDIVAHRGAAHDAPENTLASFNLGLRQGADAIEGDFMLTKDGKIVCIHDKTTERLAKRTLTVAESTLAELKQLDVGSWKGTQWAGEQIPSIHEVLTIVPENKKILIEIKCGPEIIPLLKVALTESGLKPAQTVVIAFDAQVVAGVKKQIPSIKAFWLTDFKQDEVTGVWSPTLEEVITTLKEIDADGLDCRAHALVDHSFVSELRKADMEFHVWTVDEPGLAKRFKKLGVDSMTTNRPGWLREQLQD